MIEHPAGQHRFGTLLDPLVDECGDFVTEVGGVVEPGKFKALQGRAGRGLQVVQRRCESRHGHGLGSNELF